LCEKLILLIYKAAQHLVEFQWCKPFATGIPMGKTVKTVWVNVALRLNQRINPLENENAGELVST